MIPLLQRLVRNPVRALGSARLTAAILAAALLVLLVGTLAQGAGVADAARARFFGSWIALVGPLPLPGIKLIAAAAAVNLALAAAAGPRRSGRPGERVVRAGLVCLIAAGFAAEALNRTSFVLLREGATVWSSFDPGSWDLRLEPSAYAAPLDRLREGEPMPGQPGIIVERRFDNSRPLVGPSADELSSLAPLRPESDSADNRPGVILRVASPDGPIRTVVWAGRPTPVGGAPRGVTARLARREVPLSAPITLTRLEVSRYPGSGTPQSMAAHLKIGGGAGSSDAVVRPGRPVRLGRDTVYLISQGTDLDGEPALILGIGRSPARTAIYVSAALVLLGLGIQAVARMPAARDGGRVGAAALALALGLLAPAPSAARDRVPLAELGRMPVLSEGRLMPLETYARLTLRQLSGSQRIAGEPALGWMTRILLAPESTLTDPLFQVRRREALLRAGLSPEPGGRLTYRQIEPASQRIAELAQRYSAHRGRGPVEEEIVSLASRVALYTRLAASADYDRPHEDFAVPAGDDAERLDLEPGPHSLREIAEARERLGSRWADEPAAGRLREALSRWAADYSSVVPAVVPDGKGSWTSPAAAMALGGKAAAAAMLVAAARDQFRKGEWEAMRRTLAALERSTSAAADERGARRVRLEAAASWVQPFAVAMVLQGLALALLIAVPGRRYTEAAAAIALLLGCAGLAAGLLLDALIAARPPVATLGGTFASVALVLSLAGPVARLARAPRTMLGLAAAAGLLLTLVGRGIAAAGDEHAVLPAALDAPLWLAVHVGTICLGYAAALAAAALGHLWLARRVLAPQDVASLGRLEVALPAVLRVALLLTAAGTLLGAAWADRAWGRFWAWDPKEGAALLLVLWTAAVLQGVGSRLLRAAGMAVASASLVLPVAFSWLGVNLMRTGLHTAGFVAGGAAALALAALCVGEAAFLTAAVMLARLRRAPADSGEQVWHRPPG